MLSSCFRSSLPTTASFAESARFFASFFAILDVKHASLSDTSVDDHQQQGCVHNQYQNNETTINTNIKIGAKSHAFRLPGAMFESPDASFREASLMTSTSGQICEL